MIIRNNIYLYCGDIIIIIISCILFDYFSHTIFKFLLDLLIHILRIVVSYEKLIYHFYLHYIRSSRIDVP